jgi:hypothetical protein
MLKYSLWPPWLRGVIAVGFAASACAIGYHFSFNFVLSALSLVLIAFIACASTNNIRRRWNDIDWRVRAILTSTIAVILVTFASQVIPGLSDPVHFPGAFYAAWVAAIASWAVVGVIGAIVSLANPAKERFEVRAGYLLGTEKGEHIEYVISKLKALEHYIEKMTYAVIFSEFKNEVFRVEIGVEFIMKSFIKDVETSSFTDVEWETIRLPPDGCDKSRILYFRVDKQIIDTFDFGDKFKLKEKVTVAAGGESVIKFGTSVWMDDNEPFSHKVTRFTKVLNLVMENQLGNKQQIKVRIKGKDLPESNETINSGAHKTYNFGGLAPPSVAFEFFTQAS